MLVNFDCSAYFVRDRDALLRTFTVTPEYLRTAQDNEVVNFRDWGIQLGRRFRALKLWFVIRSYGLEGLRDVIRRHVRLASELAGWINAAPEFELMAPVPLGLVCFRYRPTGADADDPRLDDLNAALLTRVNATRRVHLTHTRLGGRYVIRVAIGQRQTELAHVEEVWRLIQEGARAVSS
jgi:aromatic-L-amino-acid decarboxylase